MHRVFTFLVHSLKIFSSCYLSSICCCLFAEFEENVFVSAQKLKDLGTYIISIGLGTETSFSQLRKIANSREAVYVLKNVDAVASYIDTIAQGICEGKSTNFMHLWWRGETCKKLSSILLHMT